MARPPFRRAKEWEDFFEFLEDVGDAPSPKHRLMRFNKKKAWGPDNFYWLEWGVSKGEDAKDRARQRARDWRAKNILKVKNKDYLRKYGITYDTYLEMHRKQGGVCLLCLEKDPNFSLAVDHCHKTATIRGLLCSSCNRGIGLFKDDPSLMRAAASYVEKDGKVS